MGRTNKSEVDYWLSDDGLLLLEAWCRDGDTLQTIADKAGITKQTLIKWKSAYPEIDKALATSKEIVDYKVENALLKRALGFTTKEIKVTLGKKIVNGEVFEVLKETTTKEVAPDVTAALAWLNNRKHDQWKRNRDRAIDINDEESNVTISIIRGNKQDGLGDDVNRGAKFEKVEGKKKEPEAEEKQDEWDGVE